MNTAELEILKTIKEISKKDFLVSARKIIKKINNVSAWKVRKYLRYLVIQGVLTKEQHSFTGNSMIDFHYVVNEKKVQELKKTYTVTEIARAANLNEAQVYVLIKRIPHAKSGSNDCRYKESAMQEVVRLSTKNK